MSRSAAARLLEVAVYAPIGLVAQLRQDLPRLVEDGRAHVTNRVQVARWVGEMSVQYGRAAIQRKLAPHTPAPDTDHPPAVQPAPPVPSEPFHGYATLSAAEIVPLLARLPHGELEMVRHYEAATRARRTVLAKLNALLTQ